MKNFRVDMKITYKLDGKEIAAKDMLGKSGKVEIHVTYTNKSSRRKKLMGKETTIYTPFVMVTAMVLSSDHFENVEVDNARIVNDGDNQMIIGMGVPGMAENLDLSDDMADKIPSDFTVTADTKDFTIGNTFTYGSASLLNDLDLDDVDELDDLEEKLNDLTDASDKLVDGSDDLYDNLKLFDSKMGELNTSVKKFQKEGVNRVGKWNQHTGKRCSDISKRCYRLCKWCNNICQRNHKLCRWRSKNYKWMCLTLQIRKGYSNSDSEF